MYGMGEVLGRGGGGDDWAPEDAQVGGDGGEVDNTRSYAQFDRGSAAGRMLYNLYNRGKGVETIYRPNVRLKQKASGLTPMQEAQLKIKKKAEEGFIPQRASQSSPFHNLFLQTSKSKKANQIPKTHESQSSQAYLCPRWLSEVSVHSLYPK